MYQSWWMKTCWIIVAQNWSEIVLCFAIFFVHSPYTPIFTALYPASHKLVLCFCDTVILVLWWYEPATSQNLLSSQYCKQMERTMFRARQFVYWTCSSNAAYNALYYSMQFKNQRSKHVINVLSELAYIGCVTWFKTSEINFDWLCLINYMCSLFVFDYCHLCLPVWMTCALECRMCFENENVFRVLLKSLSEICKLCFTMRNGLRYWQQTAQLA